MACVCVLRASHGLFESRKNCFCTVFRRKRGKVGFRGLQGRMAAPYKKLLEALVVWLSPHLATEYVLPKKGVELGWVRQKDMLRSI